MIKCGLCSITLRQMSVDEIISLVSHAGLEGIEWGGDVHVPHGSFHLARQVRDKTLSSGLTPVAYGSYYRVGVSEDEGLSFESVLQTAVALGVPTIRVWAGNKGSAQAGIDLIERIVADTHRIGKMAQQAGVTVAFEYHGGTLTDTRESAVIFADQVKHDAIKFYWQPRPNATASESLDEIHGILDHLCNIHVFHWTRSANTIIRHSLQEGFDVWSEYFKLISSDGQDHYALLEFVEEDKPSNVLRDAMVLRQIVSSSENNFDQ